jgi:hypothetical protein
MSAQGPDGEKPESISQNSFDKPLDNIPQGIQQDAELITEKGNVITHEGVILSSNNSDSGASVNPFEDPEVKAYFVEVYEKSKYECRHVFDADLTWTPEEEKAVIRKLDWRGESSRDEAPELGINFGQSASGPAPCSSVCRSTEVTWRKPSLARFSRT